MTTCEGKTGKVIITTYDYDEDQPTKFNWKSTIPINCVIVKGGNNALVYRYDPAVNADTGLSGPDNDNNEKIYAISHASFGSPPMPVPEWPILSVGLISIFGILFLIAWRREP